MAFYSFKISSISKPNDLILQCINDSFKTSNLVYIDILCAAAEPWYCVCEKLHIWASHIIVTCPIFHIFFITISMCVCVYIYMLWSIQTKGKQKGANIYAFLNIRACRAGWRGSKNQPFDPLTPLVFIQYKPLILIWIVIKRQASTQAQFEHDAAWFMMNVHRIQIMECGIGTGSRKYSNLHIELARFFGDGLFCWIERKKQAAN